jgi:hypothetical protein
MSASAYICVRAGAEVVIDATDPSDVALALQEMLDLAPKALIRNWWLGEFKASGPGWYRVANVEPHGPAIGLWLVGQLGARGWEVFQVDQGRPISYHLRRLTGH